MWVDSGIDGVRYLVVVGYLPLVTAVLITPNGAEPPDSSRIGVIGALDLILPTETV